MNEDYIRRLTDSLEPSLDFVNKVINDFDNGNISKLYNHLSDEDRKIVLKNKSKIKDVVDRMAKELAVKSFDEIDGGEIAKLKEELNTIDKDAR